MRIPTILAAACLMLVSCQPEEGCTDPAFDEYDPSANVDDGSCQSLTGCSTDDFTSMDGYDYDIVAIGDQCWFAENLRTTTYNDGTVIPAGLTDDEWTSTTEGATAVYGEGSSDCESYSPDIDACDDVQSLAVYGRLYNWYAVNDTRGLCPSGWHVPTDDEWTDLENFVTSQELAGTALKSTSGWYGSSGTDDFGFSALPAGGRSVNDGSFNGAGENGLWYSSSPDSYFAWYRYLTNGQWLIGRVSGNPGDGLSVRCLRD